tara:strand:- start:13484 stop:14086 length:603 start_codon:yes stop_codon:yes gene_type:complete
MSKTLSTPVGSAYYPRIDTPDTKFNPDGVYSCKLHVDEGDYNAFELTVKDIVNKAYKDECTKRGVAKLKIAPTSPIRQTDDGEYEIYAKQVAKKDTRKGLLEFNVAVFDAKGQKLQETPKIGSGSKLKMGVEIYPYYTDLNGFGYTLRLKAVQIIDLVEYSAGDASSYGFSSEEEGYTSSGETFNNTFEKDEVQTEQAPF